MVVSTGTRCAQIAINRGKPRNSGLMPLVCDSIDALQADAALTEIKGPVIWRADFAQNKEARVMFQSGSRPML
jgi:hypothetical protein